MNENAGWSEYQKLVMSELADLKSDMATVNETLVLMRIDLAMLKVKAGLWGGATALVVALAAYVAKSSGVA